MRGCPSFLSSTTTYVMKEVEVWAAAIVHRVGPEVKVSISRFPRTLYRGESFGFGVPRIADPGKGRCRA